jgi:hypothetical protein
MKKTPVSRKVPPVKIIAIGFESDKTAEPVKDNSAAIAARIAKGQPMKATASLGPDYSVDKRREARREHTNHFTNRAPTKSK